MDTPHARKPYPSDVSDEEWAFVAPYLTLMTQDAPQRTYPLRELFNGARWIVRAGAPWRMLPSNLPPWHTVYEQTQRRINGGCFAAIVHDLRVPIRNRVIVRPEIDDEIEIARQGIERPARGRAEEVELADLELPAEVGDRGLVVGNQCNHGRVPLADMQGGFRRIPL